MENTARLLKPKDAATYIGMSHSWLAKSRLNGPLENSLNVPKFIKVGSAVLYDRKDLDSWIDSHYRLERI